MGIFTPIVSAVVSRIVTWTLEAGEMQLFFLYTDFRVNRQGRSFIEALNVNQDAQRNGSDDDKKKAEEMLIDRFRELIKFTN